ncbi:MAG TPA: nuclear transport factor 2 family protein [Thermoleophilaceae bacterium]|jgi:hypothetical protein
MPTITEPTLGSAFAEALAKKDFDAIASLLHPEIDFRGLTPGVRNWEGHTPDEVIQGVLRTWFEDSDEIEELVHLETDSFSDRQRVSYRFRGHNPDGEFVVEQQAYLDERDGKIVWMRVLCSGFRPLA